MNSNMRGLTQAEAEARLRQYGKNELPPPKQASLLKKLLANFTSLMALLLWGGGVMAILSGAPELGVAIFCVNLINGLFSYFQEFKAEKATNAYNTLKDWGMQISLGAVTTQPCIAVSSLTNEDHMFALTPSGSSTDIIGGQPDADGNVTIPRKDNMFQMCFTDPNQGTKAAEYINQQKLGSKIAIIYDMSDAYSSGIYNKFKAEADKLNLEIVYEGTFTADSATDFTSQLNGAKNAEADLVFLPIYYQPASLILDQANKMNYVPKWFGVDGMDGILTLENFDTSLAEGVMLLTPFSADAEDEKTQNFVKKYQEKCNGQIPNQFAADAYDCIYTLYEACTKAGVTADMDASTICDKLIEQITAEDFSMDGLTGIGITWSDTGEVNKEPRGMVIQNGVYVGMD